MSVEQELLVMIITNLPNFVFAIIAVAVQYRVITELLKYMRSCNCPPRRENGEAYAPSQEEIH